MFLVGGRHFWPCAAVSVSEGVRTVYLAVESGKQVALKNV